MVRLLPVQSVLDMCIDASMHCRLQRNREDGYDNTMNGFGFPQRGEGCLTIHQSSADSLRLMRVWVEYGDQRWGLDAPGWIPLGFGLGAGGPYMWTAR